MKQEVDEKELEICRSRGHSLLWVSIGGWSQCKHCGMWLREVKTIEERRDAPPVKERNAMDQVEENLKKARGKAEEE